MNRISTLLIISGFFIHMNLYAQPFQKRELILKNRVREMREFILQKDKKILSTIYYYNDSGLVETAISFNLTDTARKDTVLIPHFLFDACLYDTSSIIKYVYDLQNRAIGQSDIYYFYYNKKSAERKIEYIDGNTNKITYSGLGEHDTFIKKHFKRNNLSVYKSYIEGHIYRYSSIRARKYKHSRVVRERWSLIHPYPKRGFRYTTRKSRRVLQLDDQERIVSSKEKSTHYIFKIHHQSSTLTYNGDLLEEECFLYKNTIGDIVNYCYLYEYKTGIKLIEK
jgi:hypothetical protein